MRLANLNPGQIEVWDAFEQPSYPLGRLEVKDLVFIGGSSDDPENYPTWPNDQFPFIDNVKKVIRKCYDDNIPLFASCMGFLVATEELGGEIVLDKEHKEIGTFDIQPAPEMKDDPLFGDMATSFHALIYHLKQVTKLPPGAVNIGSTSLCPHQGFTFPGKPFYAFQFHPELDKHLVYKWASFYQQKYGLTDADLEAIRTEFHETPESNALIAKFVERVVLPHNAGHDSAKGQEKDDKEISPV
jgi:GMP synthase (glutamine-hydrolysing)